MCEVCRHHEKWLALTPEQKVALMETARLQAVDAKNMSPYDGFRYTPNADLSPRPSTQKQFMRALKTCARSLHLESIIHDGSSVSGNGALNLVMGRVSRDAPPGDRRFRVAFGWKAVLFSFQWGRFRIFLGRFDVMRMMDQYSMHTVESANITGPAMADMLDVIEHVLSEHERTAKAGTMQSIMQRAHRGKNDPPVT